MTIKAFDLNIEEVLENWEVEHALREIIANALDEHLLSSTPDISIFKDSNGAWHIRDFGRGLRIDHFTMNENHEKLSSTHGVIGKFGVGLKDALATFHRRGVQVHIARVYILGVLASEEPNFLFSYNITSLTDMMKKKLNRERLNVGRTTYADRVKAILRNASDERVQQQLVEQVKKRATGDQCDELAWIEISQMALNLMHQRSQVVYFTEDELQSRPDILDSARVDGLEVVVISEQQKAKLQSQNLAGGPEVRTIETYVREYNSSFEYKFVEYGALTREERLVYDLTPRILTLVGLAQSRIPPVRVSETMRLTSDDTEGVWDSSIPAIVVKRSKLKSILSYAGTLLHEVGHATTGAVDATREFEGILTDYLGQTAAAAITANESIGRNSSNRS